MPYFVLVWDSVRSLIRKVCPQQQLQKLMDLLELINLLKFMELQELLELMKLMKLLELIELMELLEKKIDFQMFVIHLNGQNLKTLLLQILVIKMIFLKKIGWCTLTNFTAQTVTLGANLLVKAHPIPQNAEFAYFFSTKVGSS